MYKRLSLNKLFVFMVILLAISIMSALTIKWSTESDNNLYETKAYAANIISAGTPTFIESTSLKKVSIIEDGSINLSEFSTDSNYLDLFYFDLTTTAWYSTENANANKSIFYAFGFNVSFSEYKLEYRFQNEEGGYSESSKIIEASTHILFLNDTYNNKQQSGIKDLSLKVNSINIEGTKWNGESYSGNILADKTSVVAGIYELKSINVTYSFKYPIAYDFNETEEGEIEYLTEDQSFGGTVNLVPMGTLDGNEVGTKCKLILGTQIQIKPTANDIGTDTLNKNLGIKATYDTQIQWKNKIKLISDSLGENEFIYSSTVDELDIFSTINGFLPEYNNKTFGLHDEINGVKLADYFTVNWYNQDIPRCDIALEEMETVDSGTYYLRLELKDSSKYEIDNMGTYYHTINFTYNNNDYLQKFTVDKKSLKLSAEYSDKIENLTEYSAIWISSNSKEYSERYTLAPMTQSDFKTTAPKGYYKAVFDANFNVTYVAVEEGSALDINESYYINTAGAQDLLSNSISTQNDNDKAYNIWINSGGYAEDYISYIANGNSKLLLFDGSYFESYAIGKYDHIVVSISIGIQEIAKNYTIEIGEHDEEGTFTKLTVVKNDVTKDGLSSMVVYKQKGDFNIKAPGININIEEMAEVLSEVYYGNYSSSNEIDFSKVKVDGTNITYDELNNWYTVDTSETDWIIRIVGNEAQIQKIADKHVIYIWMRLATETENKPTTSDDYYQSSFGTYFIPLSDKYSLDNVLYSGNYNVTCTVKTFLKNNVSGKAALTICENGEYKVLNEASESILSIRLSMPLAIEIKQVQVYLNSLNVNADKYYDGTADVKSYNGENASQYTELKLLENYKFSNLFKSMGYTDILDYDFKSTLDYTSQITYNDAIIGDDKSISSQFEIILNGSFTGLPQQAMARQECYSLVQGLYINNIESNLMGAIKPRTLDVKVLTDPEKITDTTDDRYVYADYSRNYRENMYVAIKVADHTQIMDDGTTLLDYYQESYGSLPSKNFYADFYYYKTIDDNGFCFYSELPNIHDSFNPQKYVFIELSGESYVKAIGGFNSRETYYEEKNGTYSKIILTESTFRENIYYIKSGFLTRQIEINSVPTTITEGFKWDPKKTYLSQEVFNSDAFGDAQLIDAISIIIWKDINSQIVIDENTKANVDYTQFYTLGMNNDYIIGNYKISSKNTFTLNISKIALLPENVFTLREELPPYRYLTYNGESRINVVCKADPDDPDAPKTSFVTIDKHDEYEILKANYAGDFTKFVSVIGFSIDYYEGEYISFNTDYTEEQCRSDDDINKMILAGTYLLKITVEETENYKQVSITHTIAIHPITVSVYPTVATRTYMDNYDKAKEVSIATSNTYLYKDSITPYTAYFNLTDYKIYMENAGGYAETYVYYENDDINGKINTDNIHIYLIGFNGGDVFDINSGDIMPTINLNLPFDPDTGNINAGRHEGVVEISGAFKRNYRFNYFYGDLFIKKLALDVDVDGNQKIVFSGKNVTPEYKIVMSSGEDKSDIAELSMYAAAFYIYDELSETYKILVRDYDDIDNPQTREAVMISDFGINDGDYNYYFIDDNTQISIFKDSLDRFFYYENNLNSNPKMYIDDIIVPDFRIEDTENGKYCPYIDKIIIDGVEHEIYISVPYNSVKASRENYISEVYNYNNNLGGYIINMQAVPSEIAGGSATNYDNSELTTIILEIRTLELSLIDTNSITLNGTTVNPIWKTTYIGETYTFNGFDSYFEGGNALNGLSQATPSEYYWGKIEIIKNNGINDFWYYLSEDDFSKDSYYGNEFVNYANGETGAFKKATATTRIENAGLYAILLKATINDGSFYAEQPNDMRYNIRFGKRAPDGKYGGVTYGAPESEYEAYFVVYLIIERSSAIELSPTPIAPVDPNYPTKLLETPKPLDADNDGFYETYSKIYDGYEIKFGESLLVSNQESSLGEVLNVRAYLIPDGTSREILYFKSINGKLEYSDISKNSYGLSLINVNTFVLRFYVNYNDKFEVGSDNSTYNNNYVLLMVDYNIIVEKRNINVYLTTYEGEESSKDFGQKNSDVEYKFTYIYRNWATAIEDNEIEINKLISLIGAPVVDWTGVCDEENDPEGVRKYAGDYTIRAKDRVIDYSDPSSIAMRTHTPIITEIIGGKEYQFDNYYFNYGTSSLFFKINRKDYTLKYIESIDSEINYPDEDFPIIAVTTTSYYTGTQIYPNVTRYGVDRSSLENPENQDYLTLYNGMESVGECISVIMEGKILGYDKALTETYYSYRMGDTPEWLKKYATDNVAIDVGYYLFRICVGATLNYNRYTYTDSDGKVQEWFYVVFQIKKTPLRLNFVNTENGNEIYRGASEMIYRGKADYYPSFTAMYNFEDLVGNDKNYVSAKNIQFLTNKSVTEKVNYSGIQELFLVNPLYVFVDSEGRELLDTDNNPVLPTQAGQYYIKLVFNQAEGYGYSANYDIIVEYQKDEEGNVLYPIMEIQKRQVRAVYDARSGNEKITKVYNGTDRVMEGTVTNKNYTFTQVSTEVESGIIAGDDISIKVLYAYSRYARKNVYDEFDLLSDIDVYLVVVESELDGRDANNYTLVLEDNIYTDENGTVYLKLVGTILPASTTVKFYNSANELKTSRIEEQYDGEEQEVRVEVIGVELDDLKKDVDFTVNYTSDNNYDSMIPPIHCDYYNVAVKITNKNYNASTSNITLEVYPASVEIGFGGDAEQSYGDITIGLVATATGVGGYLKELSVYYCYINDDGSEGEIITDISSAPAGSYYAVAEHKRSGDFAEKRAVQVFTISRRNTYINYDIAPIYKYSGKAVSTLMYFMDNNEKFYPKLIFDILVDGEWIAYNYTYAEGATEPTIGTYPENVGTYRVKAYSVYENYYITDPVWCTFTIEKADLTVQPKDMVVLENREFSLDIVLGGLLTQSSVKDVLGETLKYKYYDAVSGKEIYGKPSTAGEYKVICYDGVSQNYNISYQFGLLTINKPTITLAVKNTGADSKQNITIEGSFNVNTNITVTQERNVKHAELQKAFDSFVEANESYSTLKLKDVYIFEYINYTDSTTSYLSKIKLYVPELFAEANNASDADIVIDESKYYVAVLSAEGNMQIIEAEKDGEYLSFDAGNMQIKALSILAHASQENNNSYDWILYLGIAVAVILIGLSLVIVFRKSK